MATEKASALRAFITGIVLVANFGSPVRLLIANDQTGVRSRLLARFCLAAAAVASIVAIYAHRKNEAEHGVCRDPSMEKSSIFTTVRSAFLTRQK
jgi:hypothetical protein